jgi:hypothetical protein
MPCHNSTEPTVNQSVVYQESSVMYTATVTAHTGMTADLSVSGLGTRTAVPHACCPSDECWGYDGEGSVPFCGSGSWTFGSDERIKIPA